MTQCSSTVAVLQLVGSAALGSLPAAVSAGRARNGRFADADLRSSQRFLPLVRFSASSVFQLFSLSSVVFLSRTPWPLATAITIQSLTIT